MKYDGRIIYFHFMFSLFLENLISHKRDKSVLMGACEQCSLQEEERGRNERAETKLVKHDHEPYMSYDSLLFPDYLFKGSTAIFEIVRRPSSGPCKMLCRF